METHIFISFFVEIRSAQNTARSEGSVSKWGIAKVLLKFKSSGKSIWRSE